MVLRNFLLFLSQQKHLRRFVEQSGYSAKLTKRFIAGQALGDVVSVARKLNSDRILVTLDHLGENVTSTEEAAASRNSYLESLRSIQAERLDSTVSVKLTQLGLDLSYEVCRENLAALVEMAAAIGTRVEVDMESSAYTDRTLQLVEEMHRRYRSVRAVLQAYLYRTEDDVRALNAAGVPIRLCKGAYREPESVAFPRKEQVDQNYKHLLRLMFESGKEPAVASHDGAMIEAALTLARLLNVEPEQFEFQMLYGIRRDLQERLVKDGFRLRLYVPYGDAWYPYFMRRLAERPANVLFLARNVLRR
ncbi:MAG: proline dehydrogenase family protein [Bryobacteraceae bacterium]|nr:proline dehydrogenase family protein [Bryobacteraceae bacterium]